jgi:plasmid stabilization system protein ParE
MTLKIIWSEFAETQLNEIYDYYEMPINKLQTNRHDQQGITSDL